MISFYKIVVELSTFIFIIFCCCCVDKNVLVYGNVTIGLAWYILHVLASDDNTRNGICILIITWPLPEYILFYQSKRMETDNKEQEELKSSHDFVMFMVRLCLYITGTVSKPLERRYLKSRRDWLCIIKKNTLINDILKYFVLFTKP